MKAFANSLGSNMDISFALPHLFMQYLQSYIHLFVIKTLKRLIHLPSGVNEWHIPDSTGFPMRFVSFTILGEAIEAQISNLEAAPKMLIFLSIDPIKNAHS